MAGIRTAPKISQMQTDMPEVYAEFQRIGEQLERHYRDVQDLEFTIERGKLYMLQTRSAKRTAAAAVKIAVDMVDEGVITKDEALGRIEPAHVDQLLRDQFDPRRPRRAPTRIAKGLNASPGAAVGRAVFDADTAVEWVEPGRAGRPRPGRDLTRRLPRHGRRPGHPDRPRRRDQPRRGRRPPDRQAVRRRLRTSCVVDYAHRQPRIAPTASTFAEGDWISVDGSTGEVFVGALPTVSARFEDQPELQTVLGWADEVRRMQVWTNADKPEEAALARTLRRPGHRPLPDRAHVPRGRAAGDRPRRDPRRERGHPGQGEGRRRRHADRRRDRGRRRIFDAAMAKLEVLQQGDFEGIFQAMDGLPVVIRLIDPPLHEFLPNLEEQLVKVTKAGDAGAPRRTASSSRRSRACTSRTRCWACAAAGSA